MNRKLKKNLSLQTIYQIMNSCLPLITAPYLARVLGAKQLGIFSYTSSVVSYFALFAMLGVANYGTRSIASVNDNYSERSKTFWEIYIIQFISSLIMLTLYLFYLVKFCRDNIYISNIQMLTIISCFFDINWFFFGIENFTFTIVRSTIIRVSTVILILTLVRSSSDLWIYTTLMLTSTLLSQLLLWFRLFKLVKFCKITKHGVVARLKPNLVLFVPLLAMSVYHSMDKTMLGLMSTYEQSGYYYNADKIINIPIGVLSGIGTVMLPRISSMISAGNNDAANSLFIRSLDGVSALSIAMAFGIAAVAKEFVPIFFGNGYDECINLTIVLSSVLVLKGWSSSCSMQFLIPYKMDSIFIKSVFIGAITNYIANSMLIPSFGAMGAVIGTVIAEFTSCLAQYIEMRKKISLKALLKPCLVYLVNGICMFITVRLFSLIECDNLIKLIFEIIVGAVTYLTLSSIYWAHAKNDFRKLIFRR